MKYVFLALTTLVIVCLMVLAVLALSYNGFINTAQRQEVGIRNQYENNQNVYDNGRKRVQELAQVPALQQQALERLFVAAISARRYDQGGELIKFIQEQNPNLDQRTFLKIQQAIEEYRDRFQASQTELISRKQTYENYLTATTGGRMGNFLAGMLGSPFPRMNMDKYAIVTSDHTQRTFETHREEPLNLLGDAK